MKFNLYKVAYEKKKSKFDKMARARGESYKYVYHSPLKFGLGSLALPIMLLSLAILLASAGVPAVIWQFPIYPLGIQLTAFRWLVLCCSVFFLLNILAIYLSIKYLDEHFFAEFAYDVSISIFGLGIILMFVIWFVYALGGL